jgi:ribosomal protein L7/L12
MLHQEDSMSGWEAVIFNSMHFLLWLALFITVIGRTQGIEELQRRLARLEKKTDAIMQHLGLEYEPPAPGGSDTVLSLIRAGKKIEAIKIYREETGAGLKEAKDAVEAIEARLRYGAPR